MPRLSKSAGLDERIQTKAAQWYQQKRIPEAFRNQHPLVIAKAEELCEGDWRRVVVDENNILIVYNKPMWEPE